MDLKDEIEDEAFKIFSHEFATSIDKFFAPVEPEDVQNVDVLTFIIESTTKATLADQSYIRIMQPQRCRKHTHD